MAFTPENAAIMQAKGVIQRKLNEELHKAELELAAKSVLITAPITGDTYLESRLVRTREYIERVSDKLIANLDEAQQVDRYASAIAKLSEIERQLAGRPMPGSLKPTQAKPRKAQLTIDPTPVKPEQEPGA